MGFGLWVLFLVINITDTYFSTLEVLHSMRYINLRLTYLFITAAATTYVNHCLPLSAYCFDSVGWQTGFLLASKKVLKSTFWRTGLPFPGETAEKIGSKTKWKLGKLLLLLNCDYWMSSSPHGLQLLQTWHEDVRKTSNQVSAHTATPPSEDCLEYHFLFPVRRIACAAAGRRRHRSCRFHAASRETWLCPAAASPIINKH